MIRPELVVKFWPPGVTAKGTEAIRAIRRPLAFVIFARPFVLIIVAALLPGEYIFNAATWARRLVGF